MNFRSKKLESMLQEYAKRIFEQYPEEHEYLKEESFLMLELSFTWPGVVEQLKRARDYSSVFEKLKAKHHYYVLEEHILAEEVDHILSALLIGKNVGEN